MAYWLDLGRTRSPMVRALHAYWSGKRLGDSLPHRDAIDPAEIKAMLPHLLIADLAGEPLRVRYRLVGTKVAAANGFDFTGRYVDELIADDIDKVWQDYYQMVHDRRIPLYGDATIPATDGSRFVYEFGIFPLSPDGTTVTQCVAVEDYGKMNFHIAELIAKTRPGRPPGSRF